MKKLFFFCPRNVKYLIDYISPSHETKGKLLRFFNGHCWYKYYLTLTLVIKYDGLKHASTEWVDLPSWVTLFDATWINGTPLAHCLIVCFISCNGHAGVRAFDSLWHSWELYTHCYSAHLKTIPFNLFVLYSNNYKS